MQNSLGIITPDITRSLGFISQEANRTIGLGIITPDITRSLGADDTPLSPLLLANSKGAFLGVPFLTWGIVIGTTALGSATYGYLVTRSPKSSAYVAFGGMASAAIGVGIAGLLARRNLARLVAGGTV